MGIFSGFGKSNVLYFPGCVGYFKFKENYENTKKVFSKLGINFNEVDIKVCCGLPALELGYDSDARKLARRNFEIFKEAGIKTIIADCPSCYKTFSQNYPEFLPDWNIEIKNIWKLVLEKLETKSNLIKNKAVDSVGFHDNCYLGRYCGIYNEPRKILELIGYEIKEIPDNHEESICSGSCGGLTITNPLLAEKIAKERILQAKRIGINKIITTSLHNYQLLKKSSENNNIEILYFFDVLALALGINKVEDKEFYDEVLKKVDITEKINEESNEEDYEKILKEDLGDE